MIPTGTWTLDTVHSQVSYAVKHAGISLFKGSVDEFDALARPTASLSGSAPVTGIKVEDENLAGAPALAGLLRQRASPAR